MEFYFYDKVKELEGRLTHIEQVVSQLIEELKGKPKK